MTTPIYLTGFNPGVYTTNGNGLFVTVVGEWQAETTIVKTGVRSAKGSPTAGAACNIRAAKSVAGTVCVQKFDVRFETLPTGSVVIDIAGCANTVATSFASMGYNPVTGFFCARVGISGKQEDNVTVQAGVWYRIDYKAEITGGNMVLDVQIDGRAITQVVVATTASTHTNAILGTVRTDHAVAWDYYFDDWIVSATSADYPIGNSAVELLLPTSDGTHNAGTNTMEDNAGADIGVVTAYNLINKSPMSGSVSYIQQATISTGSYAEVLFGDIAASHSSIIGAMGILMYTSATTTANRGATIMSGDNFATSTAVFGSAAAPVDMSDGSTTAPFYKSEILVGVVDDTTVNALKARVGFSSDVSPNPYWMGLQVEVAYVPSVGGRKFQKASIIGT